MKNENTLGKEGVKERQKKEEIKSRIIIIIIIIIYNDFSYKYTNVITISAEQLSDYSDKTMVWTTGEPQFHSGQDNETFLYAIAPGPVLGIMQPLLIVPVPTVYCRVRAAEA